MDAARLRVASVQAVADRRDLERQLAQLDPEIERLDHALKETTALIEQGSALKAESVRIEIADADIDALRKAERELAALLLQQQALATRMSYRLEPGSDARRLDGRRAERRRRSAAAPPRPNWTCLAWAASASSAGGKDLPVLARQVSRPRRPAPPLLKRAGVDTLAEAEQRHARYSALLRELDGMRKTLGIHAPKGVDALRTQRDEALARRAQLRNACPAAGRRRGGRRRTAGGGAEALREAEAVAAQAEKALAAAQRALDAEGARAQLLEGQAAARGADLQSPERAAQRQSRASRLAEARSGHDELERRAREAQAALAGHQPELVEQAVQRYENPPPSSATRSTSATAKSCNCKASWTRRARRAWANACRKPPRRASAWNDGATNWPAAPRPWTCC